MKRSLSIIGSVCLGLFISVAIIACAGDSDDNQPIIEIVDNCSFPTIYEFKRINWIDDEVGYDNSVVNFSYDENGRIDRVSYGDGEGWSRTFTVSYDKSSVSLTPNDDSSKYYFELSEDDMSKPKSTNALITMIFVDYYS